MVQELALKDTDISSHLETIYKRVVSFLPKVIVELGVRGGESSKIFGIINEEIGSHSLGIDLNYCDYSFVHNGSFVRADDVRFANKFGRLNQKIDVLFVDTSHEYEHTKREIEAWFPHVSDHALIIFHDTNLKREFVRSNGTKGTAWDNARGVVKAVEEYFGNWKFDETQKFTLNIKARGSSFILTHDPICNGLLIIEKVTRPHTDEDPESIRVKL